MKKVEWRKKEYGRTAEFVIEIYDAIEETQDEVSLLEEKIKTLEDRISTLEKFIEEKVKK